MVRIKERYLLVNIIYPDESRDQSRASFPHILVYNQPTTDTFNGRSLYHAVKSQVATLFGDFGAGTVDRTLRVKYVSNATSTCILQCSREHYRLVWAALTVMDRVPTKNGPGKPCVFRVVRVSGTIKKVEQEAIKRSRLLILAAKDEMTGKESGALNSLFGAKDSISEVMMVDIDNESEIGEDFQDD